jgi:hypothetical protein
MGDVAMVEDGGVAYLQRGLPSAGLHVDAVLINRDGPEQAGGMAKAGVEVV